MEADRPEMAAADRPEASAPDRPEMTVEYLESWEAHGATWRPLEISDELAVVELCTCYGEAVDTVQSSAPAVIEFVRTHPPP